jgi:hypothetical protein
MDCGIKLRIVNCSCHLISSYPCFPSSKQKETPLKEANLHLHKGKRVHIYRQFAPPLYVILKPFD